MKIQDAKIGHLRTIAQICRAISSQPRHVSTIQKNLLNSNITSTYSHKKVNFGPVTAKTGWRVWGTPANCSGVRVMASLLQRRRLTEVNQTLHDVWASAGLVYYIFRDSCPLTDFCQVQNSLCALLVWQHYCTALEHWASAKLCGMVQEMRLWNFRSSTFSTEGYIPGAAITLGIGPHSS